MQGLRDIRVLLVAAVLLAGAHAAIAHEGATGVVKERMDFMVAMGKAMKELGAMVQGKRPFEQAEASAHARTIEDHSLVILEQFPEGSTQHPSEALPIIWQEWLVFEEVADRNHEESIAFRQLVEQGGDPQAVLAQYVALGKACGACHDRYRKPGG